jgi:hypothetical protein
VTVWSVARAPFLAVEVSLAPTVGASWIGVPAGCAGSFRGLAHAYRLPSSASSCEYRLAVLSQSIRGPDEAIASSKPTADALVTSPIARPHEIERHVGRNIAAAMTRKTNPETATRSTAANATLPLGIASRASAPTNNPPTQPAAQSRPWPIPRNTRLTRSFCPISRSCGECRSAVLCDGVLALCGRPRSSWDGSRQPDQEPGPD